MQQAQPWIIGPGRMGGAPARYSTNGRANRAMATAATAPGIAQLGLLAGARPPANVRDMIASEAACVTSTGDAPDTNRLNIAPETDAAFQRQLQSLV